MGKSNGTIKLEDIPIEKVQEFYEWLQGKYCPERFHFEHKLSLSEEEAFDVIYFLQEYFEVLPDKFERCRECGCLYDIDYEGTSIDEMTTVINEENEEVDANFPEEMYGLYCGDCRPD